MIELPRGILTGIFHKMNKYSPPENMEPETLPAKCTVLYVEDNPDNLALVEKILTYKPNIHFLSARNPDRRRARRRGRRGRIRNRRHRRCGGGDSGGDSDVHPPRVRAPGGGSGIGGKCGEGGRAAVARFA